MKKQIWLKDLEGKTLYRKGVSIHYETIDETPLVYKLLRDGDIIAILTKFNITIKKEKRAEKG